VLVIDLDQFKSINDRFGHAVGDQVLQIFADTATRTLRASDLVGRLGGEEFAAVLYNVTRDKAVATAEHLRRGFAEASTTVGNHTVGATLSIGMVLLNLDGEPDVPELLAQADHALYRAKERGRNRVEIVTFELQRNRKGTSVSHVGMPAKSAA
jgi:diguanylate cyclase (GGDEF)-like protein